jgi:hypothetical protein
MRDLRDLVVAARTCVDCHSIVGERYRQLLSKGHPDGRGKDLEGRGMEQVRHWERPLRPLSARAAAFWQARAAKGPPERFARPLLIDAAASPRAVARRFYRPRRADVLSRRPRTPPSPLGLPPLVVPSGASLDETLSILVDRLELIASAAGKER